MTTKALFPCGGGSNLILEIGTENEIFILRTPALGLRRKYDIGHYFRFAARILESLRLRLAGCCQ